VEGSLAVGEYAVAHIEAIRAGDKKYCGPAIFTQYMQAVAAGALGKLKETGSLNLGKQLREHMSLATRKLPRASVGTPMGAYDE